MFEKVACQGRWLNGELAWSADDDAVFVVVLKETVHITHRPRVDRSRTHDLDGPQMDLIEVVGIEGATFHRNIMALLTQRAWLADSSCPKSFG